MLTRCPRAPAQEDRRLHRARNALRARAVRVHGELPPLAQFSRSASRRDDGPSNLLGRPPGAVTSRAAAPRTQVLSGHALSNQPGGPISRRLAVVAVGSLTVTFAGPFSASTASLAEMPVGGRSSIRSGSLCSTRPAPGTHAAFGCRALCFAGSPRARVPPNKALRPPSELGGSAETRNRNESMTGPERASHRRSP